MNAYNVIKNGNIVGIVYAYDEISAIKIAKQSYGNDVYVTVSY